jgi:K+-transporting ATPase ATPase A chain
MSWASLAQVFLFLLILFALTRPLGIYLAHVLQGRRTVLSSLLAPVEHIIYRWCRIDPTLEQTWSGYAGSCLVFSFLNFAAYYLLLRLQGWLPLNPNLLSTPMTADLAFNTSVSFMTNTSWQSYAGETTLSYLSQVLGVTVQSFTSAAVGIAVGAALIRSFVREQTRWIGNFWVDITRSTLYVLLPIALVAALFLCSQGVIQNLSRNQEARTPEAAVQTIPMGPVASQESIKLLSGDGGGFFNANSAHPFENPSPFTNLIEMLLILAIPAAMTYTFSVMVDDRRQGWTIFAAMSVLLCAGIAIASYNEAAGNPALHRLGVLCANLEGKETRFGAAASALFSVVTTASADGAVNSAHDSFTPIAGLVQMFNLKTGDVIFGGPGTGLVAMLFIVIVTVFLTGLMVGRTPGYLGKRIDAREMKLVMISFVATGAAILALSAATVAARFPLASLMNPGAHGLSEVLYAHASAVANNGSAFAGLNSNTPWFNLTLGIAMLVGRFLVIIPALAVAGSLVEKRRTPITSGTMPTHGPLFACLLIFSILLIVGLTFLPAFCLGPIVEHFFAM